MPSPFTKFIQDINSRYHDPGLDYLTLFIAIPYDLSILQNRFGTKTYQPKLFQVTRIIMHWKYGFGSLRTRRMVESIQRDLQQINFYNDFLSNRTSFAKDLTPFLLARSINYPLLRSLPPLTSLTLKNTIHIWHYFKLPNTPIPTTHFFQELITPKPLPLHDWRVSLPQIPFQPSLLPQYIMTNLIFLTFTLQPRPPYSIDNIYLVSPNPEQDPSTPIFIE